MDSAAFYAAYREDGRGRAAYEPSMMVALLLYCYARGVRSSRAIERALRGGCRLPRDRRAAAARSRDDRAVRRAPRARAGRAVRRGAGAVRRGRAGDGRRDRDRRHQGARPTPAATRTRDYEQIAREILEEAERDRRRRGRALRRGARRRAAARAGHAQGREGGCAPAAPALDRRSAPSEARPIPRVRARAAEGGQAPPRGGAVGRARGQRGLRGLPRARR